MTILDKEKLLKFIREKLEIMQQKDLPTNEEYEIWEIFIAIKSGKFDSGVFFS